KSSSRPRETSSGLDAAASCFSWLVESCECCEREKRGTCGRARRGLISTTFSSDEELTPRVAAPSVHVWIDEGDFPQRICYAEDKRKISLPAGNAALHLRVIGRNRMRIFLQHLKRLGQSQ